MTIISSLQLLKYRGDPFTSLGGGGKKKKKIVFIAVTHVKNER